MQYVIWKQNVKKLAKFLVCVEILSIDGTPILLVKFTF